MRLINDVLRDLDVWRAKLPAPPRAVLSAPQAKLRRWPPAWPLVVSLLIAVLAVSTAFWWSSAARNKSSGQQPQAPVFQGQETAEEGPPAPATESEASEPAVAKVATTADATPASAEPTYLWVIGSRVNMRAAPQAQAAVVATLTRSTRVMLIGRQENYVHVQTSDSLKGWIRADLLSLQSLETAPTAEAANRTSTQGSTAVSNSNSVDLHPPPLALPSIAPRTSAGRDAPDASSLHRRAMEQIRAGELTAAEQTLRNLLDGNPGHGPAMQSLAGLLIQSGRRSQLVELIGRWEAEGKAPANLRLLRARLRIEHGEATAAVLASQALDGATLSTNDALTLANLQQRAGDHAAAVTTARQVLSREPTLGPAWATLAISLDQQSQAGPARDAWRKALQAGGLAPAVAEHARNRLQGAQP